MFMSWELGTNYGVYVLGTRNLVQCLYSGNQAPCANLNLLLQQKRNQKQMQTEETEKIEPVTTNQMLEESSNFW